MNCRLSLLLITVLSMTAQTYDLAKRGDLVGDLSKAKWRFHTGDDPRWASPDFDDSDWALLAGDKPWDQQGYKQYSGFAWYRIRVVVPTPNVRMRISTAAIGDAFEMFADGTQLGRFGSLSADATPLLPHIPELLTTEFTPRRTDETLIAVRVWHWKRWALYRPGGFASAITIGPSVTVQELSSLRQKALLLQGTAGFFIGCAALFAAVYSLLLFRRDLSATEYLWFAITLLSWHVFGELFGFIPVLLLHMTVTAFDAAAQLSGAVTTVGTILFLSRFLRKPLGKLTRIYLLAQIPVLLANVYIDYRLPVSVSTWNLFATLNIAISSVIVLYMVLKDVRTSRDARLLAVPMSIVSIVRLVYGTQGILFTAGLTTWRVPDLLTQPVGLDYQDLAALIYLGITAYILTERFAESRSQQTRLRTEIEAAQQVQQLLLQQPPASVQLPIEVAYLPADEVGGDFFKIFPQSSGSVLVVVGDVSGKGLKAAMLVAGIIGALEPITSETSSPGEILRRLNEFLISKSSGGFVTCACAQIMPNGEVTLASAGHLPPYLDAKELEVESSLPLGVDPGLRPSESVYRMQPGSRLAFMTDGVVEATNRAGELFGFDRTRDIAKETPERIAEKARAFGQTDDITVLQITRAAAALA